MNRSGHRHELTYDLIQRAVHGDPEALEEILLHYNAYINALVTYETTGLDGRTYRLVDPLRHRPIPQRRDDVHALGTCVGAIGF